MPEAYMEPRWGIASFKGHHTIVQVLVDAEADDYTYKPIDNGISKVYGPMAPESQSSTKSIAHADSDDCNNSDESVTWLIAPVGVKTTLDPPRDIRSSYLCRPLYGIHKIP